MVGSRGIMPKSKIKLEKEIGGVYGAEFAGIQRSELESLRD